MALRKRGPERGRDDNQHDLKCRWWDLAHQVLIRLLAHGLWDLIKSAFDDLAG